MNVFLGTQTLRAFPRSHRIGIGTRPLFEKRSFVGTRATTTAPANSQNYLTRASRRFVAFYCGNLDFFSDSLTCWGAVGAVRHGAFRVHFP